MSRAGTKLIKSAKQALAYARGEKTDGFVAHVPEEVDVKAIRLSLGLTQPEFSNRFGFDVRAVQDWEQKRRNPERSARVLLIVIAREPEAAYADVNNFFDKLKILKEKKILQNMEGRNELIIELRVMLSVFVFLKLHECNKALDYHFSYNQTKVLLFIYLSRISFTTIAQNRAF